MMYLYQTLHPHWFQEPAARMTRVFFSKTKPMPKASQNSPEMPAGVLASKCCKHLQGCCVKVLQTRIGTAVSPQVTSMRVPPPAIWGWTQSLPLSTLTILCTCAKAFKPQCLLPVTRDAVDPGSPGLSDPVASHNPRLTCPLCGSTVCFFIFLTFTYTFPSERPKQV